MVRAWDLRQAERRNKMTKEEMEMVGRKIDLAQAQLAKRASYYNNKGGAPAAYSMCGVELMFASDMISDIFAVDITPEEFKEVYC